jgi:hypothetical protein
MSYDEKDSAPLHKYNMSTVMRLFCIYTCSYNQWVNSYTLYNRKDLNSSLAVAPSALRSSCLPFAISSFLRSK